ncbi:MAG: DUF4340 domain-containing protein [Candidatus Marinimicrobia bacterium]|nr:DUF4340 domain-containing protein [Candidatus Neomarinimicrobiota bacterium]
MVKKQNLWMKYVLLLAVALLLLLVVSLKNRRYQPKVTDVFDIKVEDVNAFTISKDTLSVTLLKSDTSWVFADPDTGIVKDTKIENFFKNVVEAQKSGFVTKNSEKYDQYNVSGEKGLKVDLKKGEFILGTIYLGRSKTSWSQDYIRYPDDPKVYTSQKKMLSYASERASFWR